MLRMYCSLLVYVSKYINEWNVIIKRDQHIRMHSCASVSLEKYHQIFYMENNRSVAVHLLHFTISLPCQDGKHTHTHTQLPLKSLVTLYNKSVIIDAFTNMNKLHLLQSSCL